ncbi:unnamed protein product [Pieris macdunnoughi]|uniref:Uncharacterized protein n=1 Tax=Pieris macdunnoughi TaxID=345717 RepID=A0A821U8W9_9NEOP|nr:unnamed protein product [Pieris macdunnoughi]
MPTIYIGSFLECIISPDLSIYKCPEFPTFGTDFYEMGNSCLFILIYEVYHEDNEILILIERMTMIIITINGYTAFWALAPSSTLCHRKLSSGSRVGPLLRGR